MPKGKSATLDINFEEPEFFVGYTFGNSHIYLYGSEFSSKLDAEEADWISFYSDGYDDADAFVALLDEADTVRCVIDSDKDDARAICMNHASEFLDALVTYSQNTVVGAFQLKKLLETLVAKDYIDEEQFDRYSKDIKTEMTLLDYEEEVRATEDFDKAVRLLNFLINSDVYCRNETKVRDMLYTVNWWKPDGALIAEYVDLEHLFGNFDCLASFRIFETGDELLHALIANKTITKFHFLRHPRAQAA